MNQRIQSSIFLQPIDQHFFAKKLHETSENQKENLIQQSQKTIFDGLDNSTESDSGESKSEAEFLTESIKNNIRKTSKITERSPEAKDKNLKINEKLHSEKNFHVPNFLLNDSDAEESLFCKSKKSDGGLVFSAIHDFTSLFNKNENKENDSAYFDDNYEKFNNIKEINNFESLFLNKFKIGSLRKENENEEKVKITDLLHQDWKSKINAQKFLKFNALKKKTLDKLIKKQSKKSFKNNNNKNNNIQNKSKSNVNFTNSTNDNFKKTVIQSNFITKNNEYQNLNFNLSIAFNPEANLINSNSNLNFIDYQSKMIIKKNNRNGNQGSAKNLNLKLQNHLINQESLVFRRNSVQNCTGFPNNNNNNFNNINNNFNHSLINRTNVNNNYISHIHFPNYTEPNLNYNLQESNLPVFLNKNFYVANNNFNTNNFNNNNNYNNKNFYY